MRDERVLADLVRTRKRTANRAICRRTGGTPAAPNPPTGSLPGSAGNRQSIQHYCRESACLLGALSLDKHLSSTLYLISTYSARSLMLERSREVSMEQGEIVYRKSVTISFYNGLSQFQKKTSP